MSCRVTPAGETVAFTALRPTRLNGHSYQAGDVVIVTLNQPWSEADGQYENGDWGWGSYTSQTLERIAASVSPLPTAPAN